MIQRVTTEMVKMSATSAKSSSCGTAPFVTSKHGRYTGWAHRQHPMPAPAATAEGRARRML